MLALTSFIVKHVSMLFLTDLQSRCGAAELWCCYEDRGRLGQRKARREE
jgi:hypothetical protein